MTAHKLYAPCSTCNCTGVVYEDQREYAYYTRSAASFVAATCPDCKGRSSKTFFPTPEATQ